MEAMFADKLSEELDDEELPADEEGNGVKWTDPDISFTAGGQSYDAQIGNPMGNEEDEFSDEEDFASDEDAASEYERQAYWHPKESRAWNETIRCYILAGDAMEAERVYRQARLRCPGVNRSGYPDSSAPPPER